MDAATFAERFGIPILILFILAWFFKRDVWPFITSEWKSGRADHTNERQQYTATISSLTRLATEAHTKHAAILAQQTVQIEALAHAQLETAQTLKMLHQGQLQILAHLQQTAPRNESRRADPNH